MSDVARAHLLVPIGTQVVTRGEIKVGGRVMPPGAVGVILEAPTDATHAYRVQFPDGSQAMLRRSQLSIRRHVQSSITDVPPELRDFNLYDYVIYRCVVGSHAFGLAGSDSDVDRRGIYLPPADLEWSLYEVPEQLENREQEHVYWELRKFLMLALKANPNVLECLNTPLVDTVEPPADELLAEAVGP